MGETSIAWTSSADGSPGFSFNPWWGCQRVSPGCERCYAEAFAKRVGEKVWGPTSPRRFFGDKHWAEPRKWNTKAERDGVRRKVFVASMADVFEDRPDLVAPRARLATLIAETPALDYLLLTKRPENIVRLWPDVIFRGHVWLGTTTEDQNNYDKRWPALAQADMDQCAARSFISYEPALGPLVLTCNGCGHDVGAHLAPDQGGCSGWFPDWVIVGAESGNGRRPFEIAWLRRVVDDCRRARIPVFVKQDSAATPGHQGRIPDELWIRQFPEVRS